MSDTSFKFVIRPGTIEAYEGRRVSVFCKVEFSDPPGRLSITGVEGPVHSGDAIGGSGQIIMHLGEPGGLDTFQPADGWTLEAFRRFLDIWDEWHLNTTRAYDAAMRAAGWHKLAKRKVIVRGKHTTLGWVTPSEHPDGLLTRELTASGNRYGCNWYAEAVPVEILDELRAFPLSDRKPAWI